MEIVLAQLGSTNRHINVMKKVIQIQQNLTFIRLDLCKNDLWNTLKICIIKTDMYIQVLCAFLLIGKVLAPVLSVQKIEKSIVYFIAGMYVYMFIYFFNRTQHHDLVAFIWLNMDHICIKMLKWPPVVPECMQRHVARFQDIHNRKWQGHC